MFALNTVDASARTRTEMVVTQSHEPDVSKATPGPAMQADEPLHISISLKIRNKSALDALTARTAPRSLTNAQFLSRYAPTKNQVRVVIKFLKMNGFIRIKVAPNNLLVTADGTASAATAAFRVNMQHFIVDGRDAFANVNDAVVPNNLGKIILSIEGLQSVNISHAMTPDAKQR